MSNGYFIPSHPSGMRSMDNQISHSQSNPSAPLPIFIPNGFNPHGGVGGLVLHPVYQALLNNSGNSLNSHYSQFDPRFNYTYAPNTGAYMGMNPGAYMGMNPGAYMGMNPGAYMGMNPGAYMGMSPRVIPRASSPLALPSGVYVTNNQFNHSLPHQYLVKNQNYFVPGCIYPHGITQVNQLTSAVTPLPTAQAEQDCSSNLGPSHQSRNRSDLTERPETSTNPHRRSSVADINSSNCQPSTKILQQLDSVQGSLDKEYADESDVPLCDVHFYNLFFRVPTRLFKGHGTPCFVCKINDEFGIVVPGAGEMRGVSDELEGACALPLMAPSAHESNAQFSSLLPSSGHHHMKNKVKKNENEQVDNNIKEGTDSKKDGPEPQEERNYQLWSGATVCSILSQSVGGVSHEVPAAAGENSNSK